MKITSGNMVTIPEPRIQQLQPQWYEPYVKELAMLRLDEIHPVVSGNKWYKLKYNVEHALAEEYGTILTFGGGYSNHLVAAAAAAQAFNLKSIGIVRGVYDQLTPTLKECIECDMQLEFVSQEEYRQKEDKAWLEQLESKYGKVFIIPEGGANEWGREGAAEIARYIPPVYTHVCVSVGSGTTIAGIRGALPESQMVFGYVPMRGGNYLAEEVSQHVPAQNNWQLFDDWHFGGFGKCSDELIDFMNGFYAITGIPLDMVYTAKMMYAVQQQMRGRFFPANARILCIHTGGLQGNASITRKLIY